MRAIHIAHLDKARPVLILTRELVRPHLATVTIAPPSVLLGCELPRQREGRLLGHKPLPVPHTKSRFVPCRRYS